MASVYEREFEFTPRDFALVRDLVGERTGIVLSEHKADMVYGRLSRRLRKLNLNSFGQYLRLLEEGNEQELVEFTNALTTNLTSFFREPHHFDYLAKEAIPKLTKARTNKRLRIWSAGCSTGEEPYTIAMTIKEAMPDLSRWDVKILATDLDSNVVAKGQAGIYELDRVNGIPDNKVRKWFRKGRGDHAGNVKISPDLQALISFKQLNLMNPWPMRGTFDVIFCRNVVIYFSKETQKVLFDRYADYLASDGFLIVGHSESLHKVTDRFQLIGKTIYKKR